MRGGTAGRPPMERPVGEPGASARAGVLYDDDAFEDDSVEGGETHLSAVYPGRDTHVPEPHSLLAACPP